MEKIISQLRKIHEELEGISSTQDISLQCRGSEDQTKIDELEAGIMRKIQLDYATDLIHRVIRLIEDV